MISDLNLTKEQAVFWCKEMTAIEKDSWSYDYKQLPNGYYAVIVYDENGEYLGNF